MKTTMVPVALARQDILVYPKEISGVVFLFNGS